ncbi:MAG TPA: CsbD family protein [Chloroflexota bacterium]
MTSGDSDRLGGKGQELKGRAQQAVGDLTGNEDQQAEGVANQGEGKLDQAKGDVKNAVDDLTG